MGMPLIRIHTQLKSYEKVLEKLKSLLDLILVCKLWRDEVIKAKSSRQHIRWHSFIFQDPSIEQEIWWSTINSYLVESPIEPSSVMIFCTDTLWSCIVQSGGGAGRRKRKSTSVSDLYPFNLPKNCSVHITVTDGVIATYSDMKTQEYDEHDMVATLIIFGEFSGVELVPFSCNHAECQILQKHWTGNSKQMPSSLQKLKKKDVKMMNLYCPMSGIDQEIGYSLLSIFDWPLIAGGYVNEKYVKEPSGEFNRFSSDVMMSGIAICGQEVRVASVLIRDEMETEQEVESVIKELAQHELPLENSFGLMYACVGRGIHVYDGAHNVESKVFKKYFPRTPLFGFFGNGEIGSSYPPVDPLHLTLKRKRSSTSESGTNNDDDSASVLSDAQFKRQLDEMRRKDNAYRMKHPPKLLHAYTTVMCLVSLPVS